MSVAAGMKIRIEYDAARYSGSFIENFAACYENVLRKLMTKTFVREVDALCNDVAAYIIGKNIGKGDVVSILIPRSEFMPVTALGSWLKTPARKF